MSAKTGRAWYAAQKEIATLRAAAEALAGATERLIHAGGEGTVDEWQKAEVKAAEALAAYRAGRGEGKP